MPVWGFHGHRLINRMAVFTIPESGLFGFYKKHQLWVEEHAVDPDKRRYAFAEEAPRHFIDLDRYGPWPHDTLPRDWDAAVERFGEERLIENGIVPWHIERTMGMLRKAFQDGDVRRILRHSTDLGHYIGDIHVPLHTTENYNGGLTGQRGIHGFWESRLPELYATSYDYLTGRAVYLRDPVQAIWDAALQSSAAVDSVLRLERELSLAARSDGKYAYEPRGETVIRVYSRMYSSAYHQMLDGMVERRLRASILLVGCCWYTAWIDAGKPELPEAMPEEPGAVERWMEGAVEQAFRKGGIQGRDHENDGRLEEQSSPSPPPGSP